jgi:hypothetical protein
MKYLTAIAVVLLAFVGLVAQTQHGLNLAWSLSPTPGITSQLVFRGTTPGGENMASPYATITNGTATSFLDTTGVAGTKYFYVLEACIGAICSAPSNEGSGVFPTLPAPPSGLSVTAQ